MSQAPHRFWFASFKSWATAHHLDHIFYAALFAVILDVVLRVANILVPVMPYRIYLLAFNYYSGVDFRTSNEKMLEDLKRSFEGLRVGDAAVEIVLASIDNDPGKGLDDKRQSLAIEKATQIKNDPQTLMVVTQLESESLRSVLPLFLELSGPQIPVIATRETDDLWGDCHKSAFQWCTTDFVPLLQLPPRNTDQAEAAVRFAVQHLRPTTHCLIMKSDRLPNDPNKDYVEDLVTDFSGNVQKYYRNPELAPGVDSAVIMKLSELDQNASAMNDVNCILYAGDLQGARKLLSKTSKSQNHPLVILSDDSVLPIIYGEEVLGEDLGAQTAGVFFMDFLDGNDWNSRVNPYVNTAFEIAKQLVTDLNNRGSWWFRLRSDFRPPAAESARTYLVDIMRQNDERRVSYDGWVDSRYPEDRTTYTFRKGRSVGTIYHVWQPRVPIGRKEMVKMDDVDYWHQPKHPQNKIAFNQ